MLKKGTLYNRILGILAATLVVQAASLFKVSYILGSYMSFFKLSSVMAPMAWTFGGAFTCIGLFFIRVILRFATFGINPFSALVYHVPNLFASAYWLNEGKVIRLFIPILCMILFIAHPVGIKAFPYALLWLIPVSLYFFNNKNIFLTSLASTFVAHAVGSVIWIYTVPMQAADWITLIPVALTERILFASGMTLVYYAYQFMKSIDFSFVARKVQFKKA